MLFVIENHVISLFIIYYTSPVARVLFNMGDNCVGEWDYSSMLYCHVDLIIYYLYRGRAVTKCKNL